MLDTLLRLTARILLFCYGESIGTTCNGCLGFYGNNGVDLFIYMFLFIFMGAQMEGSGIPVLEDACMHAC